MEDAVTTGCFTSLHQLDEQKDIIKAMDINKYLV